MKVFVRLAAVPFFFASSCLAAFVQGKLPANPAPAYLAEIKKLDAEAGAKLDAVLTVKKEEEKAGRLAPAVARIQGTGLARIQAGLKEGQNPFACVGESRFETGNEALGRAWNDFNAAVLERQDYHNRNRRPAREGAARYAAAIWTEARSAQDLAPAIEALEAMEKPGEPIPANAPRDGTLDILKTSQLFLAALEAGEIQHLRDEAGTLRRSVIITGPFISYADIGKWLQRFQNPVEDELKEARRKAIEAILKHAGSKEVLALAGRLDAASSKLQAMKENEYGIRLEAPSFPNAEFTRAWGALLAVAENSNWPAAKEAVKAVRQTAGKRLPPAAQKAVEDRLTEIKNQAAAAFQNPPAEAEKRVIGRLETVTGAASALALADTLAAEAAPGNAATADYTLFEADLRQLAAVRSGGIDQLRGYSTSQPSRASSNWIRSIGKLRDRAERESIARSAHAPELLQPPLDALPPGEAVRRLGHDLTAKEDWSRLYTLLLQSPPEIGEPAAGGDRDDVRAVKALLTGRKFEQAELFSDAAKSYREVLAFIGEMVPADAAAGYLNALRKEHPAEK